MNKHITKFNDILATYEQKLRAVELSNVIVQLSNGVTLYDIAEIRRCNRRVLDESVAYVSTFDDIYQTDRAQGIESERKAKSITSRKGGINCQKLHKDTIRKNLNTGESWNAGKKLHYDVWNKGLTKETDARLHTLSQSRMGEGNPMYGHTHTDEYKKMQSARMKELIISGQFTPNSNNKNTHWESTFRKKKFRSSWEAIYYAHYPESEYEALRINYVYAGNTHVYIVDFIDNNRKLAIEVKPKEHMTDSRTVAKLAALSTWCDANQFTMVLADQDFLRKCGQPTDIDGFDNRTKERVLKFYAT
jgi:hypothetical protein